MRLERVFDPRANSLNFIRLLLAVGVIFVHSVALSGNDLGGNLGSVLGDIFVDGFFAISGFLILSSWERKPVWTSYLWARALRILPAFWVCLVLTAAVLAPIGIITAGQSFPGGYVGGAVSYVVKNAGLFITQFDIAGTPSGLADSGWNGSLWTLFYEFLCYLGIMFLGILGLLKFKWAVPVVFVLSFGALAATEFGVVDSDYGSVIARFAIMFSAGAMVYRFRGAIPVRPWLLLVAAALVVASAFLPDYRLLAALPIAYLLITVAALIKSPRFRLRNDVSYGVYIYAFPIQQILVGAGVAHLGVPVYAILSVFATLPLAVASWFFLEKPLLRLKMKDRAPATVQESVASDAPEIIERPSI